MELEVYKRKMASIQEVNGVYPIDGADRICQYGINGWRIVDQVGKYQVGDKVIFCEVDSWIPSTIAPFLTKPEHFPKEYLGIKGEKLRTIRLRKALSQGLILPLSIMGEENYKDRSSRGLENCWVKRIGQDDFIGATDKIGADVSQYLDIIKWEAPPEFLNADTKGNFPHFLFKSDQERCISGDTNIETDIGAITIRQIVDSKLQINVKSYNHDSNQIELKPVTGWSTMTKQKKNWVKITTKTGKIITVTKNHKVWVDNLQCYRNAENLIIGDFLIISN